MSDPNHKLLTIVTPNYNSGKKLIGTCAAVASQTVDYEHLIIDSLSKDGSLEIAREFAAKDPRIVVHAEKDKGIFDGFNKGIALAKGDYVYFLCAGDILLPNCLAEIAAYFPKKLTSFVYGDCILDGKRYDGKFTARKLIEKNVCHQGIFYGRECFNLCGIYDLKYPMVSDQEFNLRCFGCRNIKKIYAPVLVALYEGGGNSVKPDIPYQKDEKELIRKHLGRSMVFRMNCEQYWGRVCGRVNREMRKWSTKRC